MTIPKAVVFDLGKVLVDFDYGIAAGRIAPLGRLLPDQVRSFIDQSPLLYQFETGLMSLPQFFSRICAETGFGGTLDEFSAFFGDIFTPIPEMVELHDALHEADLPTYIFSNTNEIAVGHIRRRFPFFANFSGYILSYQHQAMKPDAKLYEAVERETRLQGADLLYLDDRPENIEAGRKRGWQVILHEDPTRTLAAVQEAGLLGSLKATAKSVP
jgi:2-haloacid dehalogenase